MHVSEDLEEEGHASGDQAMQRCVVGDAFSIFVCVLRVTIRCCFTFRYTSHMNRDL